MHSALALYDKTAGSAVRDDRDLFLEAGVSLGGIRPGLGTIDNHIGQTALGIRCEDGPHLNTKLLDVCLHFRTPVHTGSARWTIGKWAPLLDIEDRTCAPIENDHLKAFLVDEPRGPNGDLDPPIYDRPLAHAGDRFRLAFRDLIEAVDLAVVTRE
jgi:hypothetical protein